MRRAAAVAALALAAAVPAARAAEPPPRPTTLVVALSLGGTSLQAGVVRGREVVLARGFEVEVARILARRLGGRVGRFVDVRSPGRLLASGTGGWHLAIASIEPTAASGTRADLSVPYLTTDMAVVLRRGLARPAGLAELRRRVLCAVKGSAAAATIARSVRPALPPLAAPGTERLGALLRAGACDAAVLPASEAGRFVAGQKRLLGPVTGRIERGAGLVVAVAGEAGLDVAAVDRELRRMRADGTLGRLARSWLGLDPAGLRRLR